MQNPEQESLNIYLQQISVIPLITVQEEIELAGLIQKGDVKAREKMITANLRLVVKDCSTICKYWSIPFGFDKRRKYRINEGR